MARSSVLAQILGEHSHLLLAAVTNRFLYLQVEAMINVGPLLVLKFVRVMFPSFLFLFLFFT